MCDGIGMSLLRLRTRAEDVYNGPETTEHRNLRISFDYNGDVFS